VIVKGQKNRLVDAKLNEMRGATGISCLPVSDGLYRDVLKRLKSGQKLGVLSDIRVNEGGIEVDFLGHKAQIGQGAALFARRAGVLLLVAVFSRVGWFRHKIEIKAILEPDMQLTADEDIQRMTQEAFSIFDAAIREHPEQWFWYNKKWILG
jgi:Kdo2-lipid IVA lauroyltransferase/acyltransferase